jgi:hypothetical protein
LRGDLLLSLEVHFTEYLRFDVKQRERAQQMQTYKSRKLSCEADTKYLQSAQNNTQIP